MKILQHVSFFLDARLYQINTQQAVLLNLFCLIWEQDVLGTQ